MHDVSRIENDVLNCAHRDGINLKPPLILDGTPKRQGDLFYCIHTDGVPNGYYGDWRKHNDGIGIKWRYNSPTKNKPTSDEIAKQKQQRQQSVIHKQHEAAQRAEREWQALEPARDDLPYLAKKKIPALGVRQTGSTVFIAIFDENGKITSGQYIDPTGKKKRFVRGGKIAGCFYPIGEIVETTKTIYIVEGFATGATVHIATNQPVVSAFFAGNLKKVAQVFRKKYPNVRIVIASDNDQFTDNNPGLTKAREAALAVNGEVRFPIFKNVSTKPTDFNDLMLLEGIDEVRRQLTEDITTPPPVPNVNEIPPTEPKKPKRKSAVTIAIELCDDYLFHDKTNETYARIKVDEHFENYRINSQQYKRMIQNRYYRETGRGLNVSQTNDVVSTLSAKADFEGNEHEVFLRVAGNDDAIYVDLGNSKWDAVEITANGFRVIETPPCMFVRSNTMLPLPYPENGGSIDDLRDLINVNDDDFVLIVAWLIAAYRPNARYMGLIINAPQGSGKSTIIEFLRGLIDPSTIPISGHIANETDLLLAALIYYVIAEDNIDAIKSDASNTRCRLLTGGGLLRRKLYSDNEVVSVSVRRPLIMAGIEHIATKPDLLDRCFLITPQPIKKRRTDSELLRHYQTAQPKILGAIYSALPYALRNFRLTKLNDTPRMADVAHWVTAAEKAFSWPHGTFLRVYCRNVEEATVIGLESSPLIVALIRFCRDRPDKSHSMTATAWLETLVKFRNHHDDHTAWPRSSKGVSNLFRRFGANLRVIGINADEGRNATQRWLSVEIDHEKLSKYKTID